MNQATLTLFDELIRHAKGALSSLEKWVAKQKEDSRPTTSPPPVVRDNGNTDRLHA